MTAISHASTASEGEQFASHVGVRIDTEGAPPCGSRATLDPASGGGTVATGAVLALIDAAARQAASVATQLGERPVELEVTGAAVQFRSQAAGALIAIGTVPCEGLVTDRAGDDGSFRFSVAVEVVDPDGTRVASASVQWRAGEVSRTA
jgi:hypothetical protein